MLPKNKRLNLKTDFKWVASGKKLESKYLKLFIKVGENSKARIGIAASTKFFKKATQRNRVKRLVSYAFGSTYSKLPTNINIVVLPKAGVIEVKSDELTRDLERLLKDEQIIN